MAGSWVLAPGSSGRTSSGQSEVMSYLGVGTSQSELYKSINLYLVGIEDSFEINHPHLGNGSADEWEQGMPSILQAL